MNPKTNKFEYLHGSEHEGLERAFQRMQNPGTLIRSNGEPVPKHWTQFKIGERVVIKNYTFKVAYIGETAILFEPVGIPVIGGSLAK